MLDGVEVLTLMAIWIDFEDSPLLTPPDGRNACCSSCVALENCLKFRFIDLRLRLTPMHAIMKGFGVWRSLVAHLHGVQGVEGSNPFTPTI
jgi:hypothetical protein